MHAYEQRSQSAATLETSDKKSLASAFSSPSVLPDGLPSSRPDLLVSPSVRFLNSLTDASSDDDDDDVSSLFGRVDEAALEAWDEAAHEESDQPTTIVLSMAGLHHEEATAGGAASGSSSSSSAFARLAKQRHGLWSDSRMLCFGLTALESEHVCRAFEREECEISLTIVENSPAHTVLLQTIPSACLVDSSGQMSDDKSIDELIQLLSSLQEGRHSHAELQRTLKDLATIANMYQQGGTTGDATRTVHTPRALATPRALSTPARMSATASNANFSSPPDRLSLHTPYVIFHRPLCRAQCVEVVERLRDRGLRAAVVPWEDAYAHAPNPHTTITQSNNINPPTNTTTTTTTDTLFSLHLRLTRGADSTDSLVRLVRTYMPPTPAFLFHTVGRVRQDRTGGGVRLDTRTAPKHGDARHFNDQTENGRHKAESKEAHEEDANDDINHADYQPLELSEAEQTALAIEREVDRIRRWASSANVSVVFDSVGTRSQGEPAAVASPPQPSARPPSPPAQPSPASSSSQPLADLAAQVAHLKRELAAKDAEVARTRAEKDAYDMANKLDRERLQAKMIQLESKQRELIAQRLALDTEILARKEAAEAAAAAAGGASSSSPSVYPSSSSSSSTPFGSVRPAGKLSKSAQLAADHDAALALHHKLNVDTHAQRLFEETARRNIEKQRAIRAAENGITNGASAKEKEQKARSQKSSAGAALSNVSFDPSSTAAPTAPTFASPKNPELAAADAAAARAARARAAKARDDARLPTPGEKLKRAELFTINHGEMRELIAGYKEAAGTIALEDTMSGSIQPTDKVHGKGAQKSDLTEEKNSGISASPSSPSSSSSSVPFAALPLSEQKRIQSASLWNAAHLPHMLDDVRRSSIVPGYSAKEKEQREAAKEKEKEKEQQSTASGSLKRSSLQVVVESDGDDRIQPLSVENNFLDSSDSHHVSRLTSYTSAGDAYDKLTGVLVDDLQRMSLRDRLARAERRVEEAEYDDMYRRYLQPKANINGTNSDKKRRTLRKGGESALAEPRVTLDGEFVSPTKKSKRRTVSTEMDQPSSESSDSEHDDTTMPTATRATSSKRTSAGGVVKSRGKRMSMDMSPSPLKVTASLGPVGASATSSTISPTTPLARSASMQRLDRSASSSILSSRSVDDLLYWVDILVSAIELDNPFLIGKPDPYIEVYRCRQYIWELVASTEIASKTTNATYLPLLMSVEALCNMQLDRRILFKVWTNNRGAGRTLIGELSISLAQIQENIGSKFKLSNPSKSLSAVGSGASRSRDASSGFLRFAHAELAVNSTKAAFIYPGPNVNDAATPTFNKLTSCLVRIQVGAVGLPTIGGSFGGLFGKEKPDPYLEVFRLLPDGRWDTSADQPAVVSSAGVAGGCAYRTEPAFQTSRPRFPPFIMTFHQLCYGDVNRIVRIRFRHKNLTLGWVDLSLKELYLAIGKKVSLKPASSESSSSTAAGAASAASSPPHDEAPAGYLIVKKVNIFSHLSELPALCANAGIERRPVKGVSDLPIKQLIQQQTRNAKANGGEQEEQDEGEQKTLDVIEPDASDDVGANVDSFLPDSASSISNRSALLSPVSLPSSKISRNVYRGLHHLRSTAAGKFFHSFLPVQQSLMEARQIAILMAAHPRLGKEAPIGQHFLKSNLFDPHLIPFIFTFMAPS